MPDLQKLLPPPMRRPPKPGHADGKPSEYAPGEAPDGKPTGLREGRTDDPGRRLSTKARTRLPISSAGSTSGWERPAS